MESSVNKFIECAKQRNDDIFRRISPDLKNNTFLVENVSEHKSPYSTYTSNEKLNITLAHNITMIAGDVVGACTAAILLQHRIICNIMLEKRTDYKMEAGNFSRVYWVSGSQ